MLPDAIREQLITVTRVPSIIAGILDSIGKCTVNDKVFHMGYSSANLTTGADVACSLNADNIRGILQQLIVVGAVGADDFVAHNPIPGARFFYKCTKENP